MKLPKNLKYTNEHEWIRVEKNIAIVGITDFAQSELGDIVYIDSDCIGEEIEVNEVFGTIEAVKTVSDLFMPVSGEILEFNSNLEDNPELVNTNPYDKGWIVKIKIKDFVQLDSLMNEEEYLSLIK
tara:strand:- start:651 stop:1028 length:378 start_codon:yes stop_codon:yes gene_type:complete